MAASPSSEAHTKAHTLYALHWNADMDSRREFRVGVYDGVVTAASQYIAYTDVGHAQAERLARLKRRLVTCLAREGRSYLEGVTLLSTRVYSVPHMAAAAPAPVPTGPWQDAEYRDFMRIVNGDDTDKYANLMAQERRVLDVVERVVNDARKVESDDTAFTSLSLATIGARSMRAARDILSDMYTIRTPRAFIHVLIRDDRKLYVGMFLVLVAFLVSLLVVPSGGQ